MLGIFLLLDHRTAVFIKGKGFYNAEPNAGNPIRAQNGLEGMRGMNLDAFLLRLLDFLLVGGHLLTGFQAGQMNLLGAQPAGGAGAVEGNVAAVQHDDPLAHADFHAHGGIPQEITVQQYARQLAAFHGQANALMGAQRQQLWRSFLFLKHRMARN